jgi:hypothetical protein
MVDTNNIHRSGGKRSILKRLFWAGTIACGLVVILAGYWIWSFRTYTPKAVVQDLRAAFLARNAPRPAERFLEVRYGPLTDPANRQRAFLDFFDLDHMNGLHRIVGHIPAARKNNVIGGMAQWIADYRNTMSPDEKANLRACLQSDAGRGILRQATAEYLRRDVQYRASTAPVIAELMATMAAIQQP